MPQMGMTANGRTLFLAIQDMTTGDQQLVQTPVDDVNTYVVKKTFTGTALNVIQVPATEDLMVLFGHMGTGTQVQVYEVSTETLFNISPAGLAEVVCNALAINPTDKSELIAAMNNGSVYHSTDGGSVWLEIATLQPTPISWLQVFWKGKFYPHSMFISQYGGPPVLLTYTPNEFWKVRNATGSALSGAAGISSLDASLL